MMYILRMTDYQINKNYKECFTNSDDVKFVLSELVLRNYISENTKDYFFLHLDDVGMQTAVCEMLSISLEKIGDDETFSNFLFEEEFLNKTRRLKFLNESND